MARYQRTSRYARSGTTPYRHYPTGAGFDAEPIRVDYVLTRRYTSWAEIPGSRTHVVKDGETLPGLAGRYFQDRRRWGLIADFNPVAAFDPLELEPFTVLVIPPLSFVGRVQSGI